MHRDEFGVIPPEYKPVLTKKEEDEDNYQPGRFRDDDYDRYEDYSSESEFADAGYTMKESSDDDDLYVAGTVSEDSFADDEN